MITLRHRSSTPGRTRRIRVLASAVAVALTALLLTAMPAHAVGTLLYVPNNQAGTVSVVDPSTSAIIATIPVGSAPLYTAATPDGRQVYVTNEFSNTVSVISTASNTVTATIPVAAYPIGVVIDPSGTFAYVASASGYVTKVATATDTVVGSVYAGDFPDLLAITPDGATLYVAQEFGGVVAISTATFTVSAVINTLSSQNAAIAVSPSGSQVYLGTGGVFPFGGSKVVVISTATNTVTATVPVGTAFDFHYGLAVTPDGNSVYVTNAQANTVAVISTATDTVTTTIPGFSRPSGIAINSAGSTGWVGNLGNNTVSVVDTASNTITGTIPGFSGPFGLTLNSSFYNFSGFFAPIDDQPAIDEAHAGQAIPIQFSLDGNQGLNIFNTGYPAVQQVSCSSGVPLDTATLTDTSGGSGLQYDTSTDTYTYVWKTSKAWSGTCQKFILGLNDGSTHTATFQFS